jgi:hypothetical protein
MVAVGVDVSAGGTVAVAGGACRERQEARIRLMESRAQANQAPLLCRVGRILQRKRRWLHRRRTAARKEISNNSLIME